MSPSDFIRTYLDETVQVARSLDQAAIARALSELKSLQQRGGRLFILGVGGSAGNASHAVNDFRKIAGIEAYAPTDNVSELTAWTNDVGWEVVFERWLKTSKLNDQDALLVFSVGGGSATTSRNLVLAMEHAKSVGARILSIVSRDGGRARELGDATVLVPVVSQDRITPHAEGWQGIVWHLLVNALAAC
ncbi:MAG TPA: SIS domain-containing protein [Holophagaceae bacterium]|nr:SIS domain-containing protein [Holophagaceae bacterium]